MPLKSLFMRTPYPQKKKGERKEAARVGEMQKDWARRKDEVSE
jgi:hypothetical protein